MHQFIHPPIHHSTTIDHKISATGIWSEMTVLFKTGHSHRTAWSLLIISIIIIFILQRTLICSDKGTENHFPPGGTSQRRRYARQSIAIMLGQTWMTNGSDTDDQWSVTNTVPHKGSSWFTFVSDYSQALSVRSLMMNFHIILPASCTNSSGKQSPPHCRKNTQQISRRPAICCSKSRWNLQSSRRARDLAPDVCPLCFSSDWLKCRTLSNATHRC